MKIFISYRRDDSAGYAGRLFDHLAARFGGKNIFMDIDTIEPGEDFRKVVNNAVGNCDVVLVMIGKQWLTVASERGERRLDNPRDWVRMEVSTALTNTQTRVIPVLVRGASMPGDNELPTDLKELSWRNAIELSDSRFQHDANRLIEVIERITGEWGKPATKDKERKPSRFWDYVADLIIICWIIWPIGVIARYFPWADGDEWQTIPIAVIGILLTVFFRWMLRKYQS